MHCQKTEWIEMECLALDHPPDMMESLIEHTIGVFEENESAFDFVFPNPTVEYQGKISPEATPSAGEAGSTAEQTITRFLAGYEAFHVESDADDGVVLVRENNDMVVLSSGYSEDVPAEVVEAVMSKVEEPILDRLNEMASD